MSTRRLSLGELFNSVTTVAASPVDSKNELGGNAAKTSSVSAFCIHTPPGQVFSCEITITSAHAVRSITSLHISTRPFTASNMAKSRGGNGVSASLVEYCIGAAHGFANCSEPVQFICNANAITPNARTRLANMLLHLAKSLSDAP